MIRKWTIACLMNLCLILVGCGGDPASLEDGEFDVGIPPNKSDSPYSECQLNKIVALLNDSATTVQTLRTMGVSSKAANNLLNRRNGADGTAGTADDLPYQSIQEVDDVSYVGPKTIQSLAEAVAEMCKAVNLSSVEVVFSPQDYQQSHAKKIAAWIDQATRSIDVAVYSFSDANIKGALGRAVERGVKIRVIFEPAREQHASPAGTYSAQLEDLGMNVRYINKIMHHKFAIIDGPQNSADEAATASLISGSGNWSSGAATRYDENTVFIKKNAELVLRFQREFNLLWENSRDLIWNQNLPYLTTLPITESMITDDPSVDAAFTSNNFKISNLSQGPTFSVVVGKNEIANRLVAMIQNANQSIYIASGHLRSRLVAEALMAKWQQNPNMDIKIYLDAQEYCSEWYHQDQEADVQACLQTAGSNESKRQSCLDNNYLFGYLVHTTGIPLRFKYYAYRWDASYALQMHHKYFIFDGKILVSGSYNLSDNAEHETMENMVIYDGTGFSQLISAFEDNFAQMWVTGEAEDRLQKLNNLIQNTQDPVPLVFDPIALDWNQVTELKEVIRQGCPDADSEEFKTQPTKHMTCYRN